MSLNEIRYAIDLDGTDIAIVPLVTDGHEATLYKADLQLLKLLQVSLRWACQQGKRKYVTVRCEGVPGGRDYVARILTGIGPDKMLKYLDGNPLNLRRSNLKVVPRGSATPARQRFVHQLGGAQHA